MMESWSNWSGRLTASPARIIAVSSEAEVAEVFALADGEGRRVRLVGTGHSHAPLVPTDGFIVDASAIAGVVAVDAEAGTARIRGGTRIADLGAPLREHGVALHNQGDIDRQAIAGAIATGTHGTGPTLKNLSASVIGARVILADGRIVACSSTEEPELFQAMRLNLGAIGLVTEVNLSVRPVYKLLEKMWLEPLDSVLEKARDLSTATRHFEFFWMPGSERAACKSLDETDAEPVYPLADEGSRLAWSYDVLANDRPIKHSEMEYSLPAERGPECMRALRELIHRDFVGLGWPVEYRTLAADDVWLSTAFERPTVTISVHQGVDEDDEPLFRACESVFLAHDGRPHWGKVHYLSGQTLSRLHARWDEWWRIRDQFDPNGRFMNTHLETLRP
jgi:FAD/FMN-containing dehydrogenase